MTVFIILDYCSVTELRFPHKQKFSRVPATFPEVLMGFCSDQYLKFVSLPVPGIIATEVLGGVVNPQSWGREGCRGSGMVPFERALVSSYRPSIVTFPLSLRVSEIVLLLCSNTPLFPTPPLVSPKFPMILWE